MRKTLIAALAAFVVVGAGGAIAVALRRKLISSSDAARQTIDRRKFDAILIDCDDVQSGCDLIRELRKGKSNSKSIVFAITNRVTSVKDAFAIGANFVLDKPVSADRAARSLRAAHRLILRERRRYHRHPLQTTAHVSYGNLRDVPIPLSNISEGGLALATARTADMKGPVSLRFELPGCNRSLEAKGEFVWTNDAGRVGVRFTAVPPTTKSELDAWIARQIDMAAPALMSVGR